jgi:predicted ATPase
VHVPDESPSQGAWGLSIDSIHTHDGQKVHLTQRGVTVLVGGNNVGKSTLLNGIISKLNQHDNKCETLSHIVLRREWDASDFGAWLQIHCSYRDNVATRAKNGMEPIRVGSPVENWVHQETQSIHHLGPLFDLLVHVSTINERTQYVSSSTQQQIDRKSPPRSLLHVFQRSPEVFQQFSGICERVFRRPLTLDYLGGWLNLRVGRLDMQAPPIDAVSDEYVEAMMRLPLLGQQGAGMTSMMGILMPIMSADFPIIIIDEPEAFLHPPQAYELGRALAALARDRGVQIICATHDRNFLIGLLQPDIPVSVVRLERHDGAPILTQLSSERLQSLWNDPVVRFTNVLDGLFHRVVVIAEGDDDCRFYGAALEAANDETMQVTRGLVGTEVPPSEVLFVPASGKAAMADVVATLIELGVRVVASPDLDILDDESVISKLVRSMGFQWSEFAGDYQAATVHFREKKGPAKAQDVLAAVTAVLSENPTAVYDTDTKRAVAAQMRVTESPWAALKQYGVSAFKVGNERAAAVRLLDALAEIGIVVVRDGQLESLAPTLGVGKGPRWLPAALRSGAHAEPLAQRHVLRIMNGGSRQASNREPFRPE